MLLFPTACGSGDGDDAPSGETRAVRHAIGENADSTTQFERNPLWETLPAVQEGRVLQVPGQVYNGGTHSAAELLLREIEQMLT